MKSNDSSNFFDEVGLLKILIGAAIGFLFQQYRTSASADINLLDDHINDLVTFRDLCTKYWLSDQCDNNRADAARARAALVILLEFNESSEHILGRSREKYLELTVILMDEALGGTFDTEERSFDPERAEAVIGTTAKIIALLRQVRRRKITIFEVVPSTFSRIKIWRKNR